MQIFGFQVVCNRDGMCADNEKPADKEICQAPDCEEDVLGKDCEDRVCLK